MIKVLQMCGKTDVYTYNVRVAAIQDWPGLFLQRWAKPWKVLWSEYPYNPPAAYLLMSGIALTALAVSWRQRKFWYGIFCFAGMVYGAYIVTFFTIWEFFETFRMHCYSVPFIAAVLYAVVLRSRQTVFCNEALVVAACLILVYAGIDFTVQKVWLLGNRQDEIHAERVRKNLLPELSPGKYYRLTTMGGFYGRVKFAQSAGVKQVFVRKTFERDREFFGAPMHLHVMFSSGFFLYEPDNPVWSDSLFINNHVFLWRYFGNNVEKRQIKCPDVCNFFQGECSGLAESVMAAGAFVFGTLLLCGWGRYFVNVAVYIV